MNSFLDHVLGCPERPNNPLFRDALQRLADLQTKTEPESILAFLQACEQDRECIQETTVQWQQSVLQRQSHMYLDDLPLKTLSIERPTKAEASQEIDSQVIVL